jgi:hypothetical protein
MKTENEQLSTILEEISLLREELNKLYDKDNLIDDNMLGVSSQLDDKIKLFLDQQPQFP